MLNPPMFSCSVVGTLWLLWWLHDFSCQVYGTVVVVGVVRSSSSSAEDARLPDDVLWKRWSAGVVEKRRPEMVM